MNCPSSTAQLALLNAHCSMCIAQFALLNVHCSICIDQVAKLKARIRALDTRLEGNLDRVGAMGAGSPKRHAFGFEEVPYCSTSEL